MLTKKTPIKGFSRYTTDGARVYLRIRPIPASGDVYKLIPDNGDGVNLKSISVEDALKGGASGNEEQRKTGSTTTKKRSRRTSTRNAKDHAEVGKRHSKKGKA